MQMGAPEQDDPQRDGEYRGYDQMNAVGFVKLNVLRLRPLDMGNRQK